MYFVVEEERADQGRGLFHWLVGISFSDREAQCERCETLRKAYTALRFFFSCEIGTAQPACGGAAEIK